MKKLYTVFIVLVLLSTADVRAEQDNSSPAPDDAVGRAVGSVLSYFTPVSGEAAEAADKTIKVRFAANAAVRKGMRFSVFRKGRPFYHPVTNELIGNVEEMAGKAEATGERTGDGLDVCTVISGGAGSGDIVRISASKIRLAFFQEKSSDWELSEAFYASIKSTERFMLLESYASSYVPSDLAKLAAELNAEAFLVFSTPVKEEQKYLRAELYWTEGASPLGSVEESAGEEEIGLLAPEEKFIVSALTDREPWGSYRLPGGQLFAVGDVDGNGADELVVGDGRKISIYGFGQELQEIWSVEGYDGRYLSMDVLDANGNGRDEIFVTVVTEGDAFRSDESKAGKVKAGDARVRSFAIEYETGEGYKTIKDNMPYFLRVVAKRLLMQKAGGSTMFSGPVFETAWKEGDYLPGRQLPLPPDVNIYGFAYADWQNNGQAQIITFDDRGYLILYDSRGNPVWKSGRSYGKFSLSFEKETYSLVNPSMTWTVRGRLAAAQTERGTEIIVVHKIPLVEKVPGIGSKGAEVFSLWWNGSEMEEKMVLGELPGSVSDYFVKGNTLFLLSRGGLWSLVKSAATGDLFRGSVLYYHRLGAASQ